MGYDLLLKNGTIVDGTGKPGFRADVGITGGKIAEIGQLNGNATRVIEVEGLVGAPGAIDIHTHYDAQVCWDGLLSTSSEHGTTTVVQGNCGIGVAPCRPQDREAALQDLIALEGMSYDTLTSGITWSFETFPEYLAYLQHRGLGINVAAFVPLSTLRRYTLGEDANERAATPAEREQITRNLHQAMDGGAIGFSASLVRKQVGYKGRPLASVLADRDELMAYGGVLRDLGRGVIQANVTEAAGYLADDEYARLELLSSASGGRPVTFSNALYRPDNPPAVEQMLQKAAPLRLRGIVPQSTTRPFTAELDFRNPTLFASAPAFKRLFNEPVTVQKQIYADPEWRAEARAQVAEKGKLFRGAAAWLDGTISRVGHEHMRRYLTRSVREIAAERGGDPFDTVIDLALEDDLELKLLEELYNTDAKLLGEHIKDPRLLIGQSDAGAHVDQIFESSFPSYMLGHWVREQQAVKLEHAIARMSSEPAGYFGIKDRGRLAPGMAADMMIFDAATIGSPKKADQVLYDLPGGGIRLNASTTGMSFIIVNGEVVYDHGRHTGALPGRIVDGR